MAFIDPDKIPPTGEPRIDAGHRDLAERVNAAYEAWSGGEDRAVVLERLHLFLRAVGRHFAEEEAIAREAGYDGLEEHQARHRELLRRLTGQIHALDREGSDHDRTVDVFSLIDTLFYEHEILEDQDFWVLFRQQTPAPVSHGPAIIWTRALELGIGGIDRDHQDLAALFNRLKGAAQSQASATTLLSVLQQLRQCALSHFAAEEALMRSFPYEERGAHLLYHRQLEAELDAVIAEVRSGQSSDLALRVESFFAFWLIDHIGNVDRLMVEALHRHGAKCASDADSDSPPFMMAAARFRTAE